MSYRKASLAESACSVLLSTIWKYRSVLSIEKSTTIIAFLEFKSKFT